MEANDPVSIRNKVLAFHGSRPSLGFAPKLDKEVRLEPFCIWGVPSSRAC